MRYMALGPENNIILNNPKLNFVQRYKFYRDFSAFYLKIAKFHRKINIY